MTTYITRLDAGGRGLRLAVKDLIDIEGVPTTAGSRAVADQAVPAAADAPCLATLNGLMLEGRTLFIADTYVNEDPDAETLVNITLLAADEVLRFGIQPKVALLSHSSFGGSDHPSARKMAEALQCSIGTVASRLSRGHKMLAELLRGAKR